MGCWHTTSSTRGRLKELAGAEEPLNGDYFHRPELLEPGRADRELLQPLYVAGRHLDRRPARPAWER